MQNFKIALIGNPNCGKSSLFNQLTGLRQKVGNFHGVTVDKKSGVANLTDDIKVNFIDFPGTYSFYPTSIDERIVVGTFACPEASMESWEEDEKYDAILYVADITQLEKHLLLFSQIRELGLPMVLALNMADVAKESGLEVDLDLISKKLNVPVVQVSGRTGEGIDGLKKEIINVVGTASQKSDFSKNPLNYIFSKEEKAIAHELQVEFGLKTEYQAWLWAQHFEWLPFMTAAQRIRIKTIVTPEFDGLKYQVRETMQRFEKFGPIVRQTLVKSKTSEETFSDKVDRVVTHRFMGPIIFFGLMMIIFQAIFSWSGYPMDLIEAGFGKLDAGVKALLNESMLRDLLTDGILAGLGGVLIFIPQIAILFFLISILEESGYMARAVYLFDNSMRRFGLNGRSIVALVSGGACAIPAIMSTRTISNWKERLITIMVTPLISCSARLPVYAVLVGFVVAADQYFGVFNMQGLVFMGLYLLGIIAALGAGWVFNKILKTEETSYLMLEMPVYRMPMIRNVLLNVYEKTKTFVIEAGKVIFVISIVLWLMASFAPGDGMKLAEQQATTIALDKKLDEAATENLIAAKKIEASYAGHVGKFIEPVIRPLGFDWKIGIALITSFAAREVFVGTMATIYSIGSDAEETSVIDRMATEVSPDTGELVYNRATSLSLLIFYVFAMQCMSTLAVVKRETKSWKWAMIQFVFMTALAYLGSLFTYQMMS
ncbi:MAG: ferrous iron transport protein B [Saprospiraceae bacterium]